MHTTSRKIHLVDIENICGVARPTRCDVQSVRGRYETVEGTRTGDLVVLACNHGALLEVGLGWPAARLIVRSGVDGADLALLDVIQHENITARFNEVVIASGDGIFAEVAALLAERGLDVTVVSRRRALSRRLRMAAGRVRYLPEPELAEEAA